jgi:integrase
VSDGKVFKRVLKGGVLDGTGVTVNVVWYAVKRCAGQAGISNLAPHDLRRTCARLCHGLRRRTGDRLGISVASDAA